MGFGCSSDLHQSPLGYSHFKDKIIRGRFVEGTLSLNWIKVQCRETVAFQAVAFMYFLKGLVYLGFPMCTFSSEVGMRVLGSHATPITTEVFLSSL